MPSQDEVLRAAVVMLHATVEDALRTVAVAFIPTYHDEIARRSDRAGQTPTTPEEWLKSHAAAVKSITDSLERRTFNSRQEIWISSAAFSSMCRSSMMPCCAMWIE